MTCVQLTPGDMLRGEQPDYGLVIATATHGPGTTALTIMWTSYGLMTYFMHRTQVIDSFWRIVARSSAAPQVTR